MRLAAGMLQELPVYFAATSDGSLHCGSIQRGEFVNRVTDAERLPDVSPDKRSNRTVDFLVSRNVRACLVLRERIRRHYRSTEKPARLLQ